MRVMKRKDFNRLTFLYTIFITNSMKLYIYIYINRGINRLKFKFTADKNELIYKSAYTKFINKLNKNVTLSALVIKHLFAFVNK